MTIPATERQRRMAAINALKVCNWDQMADDLQTQPYDDSDLEFLAESLTVGADPAVYPEKKQHERDRLRRAAEEVSALREARS